MLKLMKYEFRKNRTLLLVLLGVIAALEGLFIYSTITKDEGWLIASVVLLVVAAYGAALAVFIMGVSSYSRELNQKSSYLVFMTPRSSLSIIASKLVFTLLTGFCIAAVLIGLAAMDVPMMFKALGAEWRGYMNVFNTALGEFDMSVERILNIVAFYALYIMADIVSSVCVAYLAITLTATIMRGKKFHALVAVVFYLAISFGIGRLNAVFMGSTLTNVYDIEDVTRMLIPSFFVTLGVIAGSIGLSAWMLKNKVEL